jgi:hypothetical protein
MRKGCIRDYRVYGVPDFNRISLQHARLLFNVRITALFATHGKFSYEYYTRPAFGLAGLESESVSLIHTDRNGRHAMMPPQRRPSMRRQNAISIPRRAAVPRIQRQFGAGQPISSVCRKEHYTIKWLSRWYATIRSDQFRRWGVVVSPARGTSQRRLAANPGRFNLTLSLFSPYGHWERLIIDRGGWGNES